MYVYKCLESFVIHHIRKSTYSQIKLKLSARLNTTTSKWEIYFVTWVDWPFNMYIISYCGPPQYQHSPPHINFPFLEIYFIHPRGGHSRSIN